jgi:hypothetical protein
LEGKLIWGLPRRGISPLIAGSLCNPQEDAFASLVGSQEGTHMPATALSGAIVVLERGAVSFAKKVGVSILPLVSI